jgi:hypothetical protein
VIEERRNGEKEGKTEEKRKGNGEGEVSVRLRENEEEKNKREKGGDGKVTGYGLVPPFSIFFFLLLLLTSKDKISPQPILACHVGWIRLHYYFLNPPLL